MTATPGPGRDDLDKLERKHAENPAGRYFVPLANAYRRAGAVERAIGVLRAGLESHPDYLSAHIVLGRCLLDAGRDEEAAAEFRYVLSLDPQNLIALRSLGDLALAGGEMEEGRARYRELLEVDPLNPEARAALDAISTEPDVADVPEAPVPLRVPAAPETLPSPDELDTPDAPEHDDEPFDDGDYASGEIAPAAPESGDEDQDALFGTMINLDEGSDSPGDSDAVVTETIAELYTRQGFYSRAAGIYRELIRRRGAEDRLVRALERVEALASGGAGVFAEATHEVAEGVPEVESPLGADGAAEEGTDKESLEVESPEAVPGEEHVSDSLDVMADADTATPTPEGSGVVVEAVAEPAGYGAPPPEIPAEDDPFADSFADGFPAVEDAGDEEATEVGVAARAEGSAGENMAPPAASGTIRDLLASVVGWRPHAGAPAPVETTTVSAPPVAPAGDDLLFPWELPEDERPAPSAEASADEGEDPAADEALPPGDDVAFQPADAASSPSDDDEAGETVGSEMAAQPGLPEEASTAEDEDENDDDLESFQEWLRSLRR